MRAQRTADWLVSVAVVAILGATLFPIAGEEPGGWVPCLVCGDRGIADVLLNVILFVPFGAALALQKWPTDRCVLAAALLSASIEFAQVYIPGRDSSLGDVLSNGSGATIGILLARTAPSWIRPRGKRAGCLCLAAAAGTTALFGGTGLLLAPSFPRSLYYGQWTPNLAHLEWYRGHVLEATLAGLPLAPRQLDQSARVRSLLMAPGGLSLHVLATAGPRVPALGVLFSIFDAQQREIILLGPDRDDLVFRVRIRAADLRLDQPDLRLQNAMRRVAPGDTLNITVRGSRGSYCVVLNGTGACGLGFTVGSGWSVLVYHEVLPAWLKTLLGVGWVGGLLLPLGYWARAQWETALACGVVAAGLLLLPPATHLLSTPPREWLAAVAGFLAGGGLARVARFSGESLKQPATSD